MKIKQFTRKVLVAIAAGVELLTGIALTLVPAVVVHSLLGGELAGPGIGVARICGLAMLALGIACWPMPQPAYGALRALLIYNLLITLYLAWLLVRGVTAKGLPLALAVHAVLTVLLAAVAYFSGQSDDGRQEVSEAVVDTSRIANSENK